MGGIVMEAAIHDAIARAAGLPMVWGRDDCCLWVAGIVAAAIGTDPAAAWRGYRSARGARRKLGRDGVPGALASAARAHGWPEIDPAEAVTGDLAAIGAGPMGGAAAIRLDGWWVGRDDHGVGFLPPEAATRAWRVLPCQR